MVKGGSKALDIEQPIISIVMATYNAANVLNSAIESVITHAPQNTQLIIIDGASTDSTVAILQQCDKHISTWISEPDKGIYDALNKGVSHTNGQWVYFMGADDHLLPGFKEMAQQLKNTDTLYYGNVETDGPLFLGKFSEYRLAKYCINHQAIFYPAKVFKKYSYDIRYNVLADYALNIACWGDSSIIKKYYPVNVAFYSTKGYSSQNVDRVFQEEKLSLIKKHMSWFTYLRFLYKRIKEKQNPGGVFNTVNPR